MCCSVYVLEIVKGRPFAEGAVGARGARGAGGEEGLLRGMRQSIYVFRSKFNE